MCPCAMPGANVSWIFLAISYILSTMQRLNLLPWLLLSILVCVFFILFLYAFHASLLLSCELLCFTRPHRCLMSDWHWQRCWLLSWHKMLAGRVMLVTSWNRGVILAWVVILNPARGLPGMQETHSPSPDKWKLNTFLLPETGALIKVMSWIGPHTW